MRIYQELFPERLLKAKKLLDLNGPSMMRSPSFSNINKMNEDSYTQIQPQGRPSLQRQRSASNKVRIRNPKKRMAIDVEFALQEFLAKLSEQNIFIEIRKVPDKELIYEIKMPEKPSTNRARFLSQGHDYGKFDEKERLVLQANLLGVG